MPARSRKPLRTLVTIDGIGSFGLFAASIASIPSIALSAVLLLNTSAAAQALNPAWVGPWRMTAGHPSSALPASIQISTQGGKTIWARQARRCGVAYDGQLSPAALHQHVAELKDWQLRPENWPPGTNPQLLIGLRKELDDAQALLQSLPPGNYRRVRTTGPGCTSPNDAFWLLAGGTRLLGVVFPVRGLGAEVAEYRRGP